MASLQPVSESVLQAEGEDFVALDGASLEQLREMAERSSLGRARVCAHPSADDPIHEMMIWLTPSTYVRPHRHHGKSESFHVIQGEVDIVLFDESGEIVDLVSLGACGSGRDFYYRLESPLYHTVLPGDGGVLVHETTNGPFDPEEGDFAEWSPACDDEAGILRLREKIDRYRAEA